MADWKKDKDLGPWAFTLQPPKWAYLNNPRWTTTPKPFVPGGDYDYTGKTEPQLWTPPSDVARSIGSSRHHQCGHWHGKALAPNPTPPTPAIPLQDINWYSCPTSIVILPSGKVLYITTDNLADFNYLEQTTFKAWVENIPGGWVESYSKSVSWDYEWAEPSIAVSTNGTITTIVLQKYNDPSYDSELDIYIYNGDSFLRNVQITDPNLDFEGSKLMKNVLVDNLGYIHIFLLYWSGLNKTISDYISTDNGVTFNRVLVANMSAFAGAPFFAYQKSDGTIYVSDRTRHVYTSVDNGANWTDTGISNKSFFSFGLVNDIFYCAYIDGSDVKLATSTDGLVWTDLFTLANLATFTAGVDFTYDGTYYYIAIVARNSDLVAGSDGYALIYSSADGTTFNLISTIIDNTHQVSMKWNGNTQFPTQIIYNSITNKLYLQYYYSEVIYSGSLRLCYWESSDHGVTWTVKPSPYIDLS